MKEKDSSQTYKMADLMGRYLSGTLRDEELEELRAWLAEDEERQRVFHELTDVSGREQLLKKMRGHDVEAGLARVKDRIVPHTVRKSPGRYIKYAAAAGLALLIGSAFWLFQGPHQKKATEHVAVVDVLPAGQKAVLVLANGSTMQLDEHGDTVITQGAASIHQQHGVLSFAGSNSPDAATGYQQLITPRAGKYEMILPDGTHIWLNAASTLRFPTRFSGKERRVQLSGEAFFDVAQDAAHPFIVEVDSAKEVHALGTAFNVKTYPGEVNIQATLISGSVRVQNNKMARLLKPGNMATFTHGELNIEAADIAAVTAWKNNMFVFRDMPLNALMNELERWYDINIEYAPGFNKDDFYNGEISRSVPLGKMLNMLEFTGVAKFKVNGRSVTVSPYK